jgi:hypothetical protein
MRVRVIQAKDEDGQWYDDAYAFERSDGQVVFRYNLAWENIGSYYNGRLQETGISLDEVDTVINPGNEMRWLPVEEIVDEQIKSYLEALDERCAIPKPGPIAQALPLSMSRS